MLVKYDTERKIVCKKILLIRSNKNKGHPIVLIEKRDRHKREETHVDEVLSSPWHKKYEHAPPFLGFVHIHCTAKNTRGHFLKIKTK